MADKDLENEFYTAVMNDVKILVKKGYKPTAFLDMISRKGAIETAKQLVNSKDLLQDIQNFGKWELCNTLLKIRFKISDGTLCLLMKNERRQRRDLLIMDLN